MILKNAFESFSAASRAERTRVFQESFFFDEFTKLLDLGSEDGSNIAEVIKGMNLRPENVSIADIDSDAIDRGSKVHGFTPILLKDEGKLPFSDRYFDVVFCSSVIEHVTVPKSEIWTIRSSKRFRERSIESQRDFAKEIERIGRQYFVQTPNRAFPLESHTWLPLVGTMPREIFVPLMSVTNRFWPKKSIPDFNLLDTSEMQKLFPEAKIVIERKYGFTKSIMAIKSDKKASTEAEIGEEEES